MPGDDGSGIGPRERRAGITAAGASVEAHLLSGGQHGFNMGQRSKLHAVQTWSHRLADWLADRGLLEPAGAFR